MRYALATFFVLASTGIALAQAPTTQQSRAQLESDLSKMLSGAVLEGSFTSDANPQQLSSDKYTLGEVKKLNGDLWLIQARIQYRNGNEGMIPLPLPILWAGDTPVIVVENMAIPGMGTFSARVMFFDNHYSGYWKHGTHGGTLFGIIKRPDATTKPASS